MQPISVILCQHCEKVPSSCNVQLQFIHKNHTIPWSRWEFPPHQLRVLNIQVEHALVLRDRACPTPVGPLSLSSVGPGTTLATPWPDARPLGGGSESGLHYKLLCVERSSSWNWDCSHTSFTRCFNVFLVSHRPQVDEMVPSSVTYMFGVWS